MHKRLRESEGRESGRMQAKPLAEGIHTRRKRGFWSAMNDDELLSHAKRLVEENGMERKEGLREVDGGLHAILKKRGLLNRVGFERMNRSWAGKSDEELLGTAKSLIGEKGITKRSELAREDRGLYDALGKRGLLDAIGLAKKQRKHRRWDRMSDAELVGHIRRFMKEKGITKRSELRRVDTALDSQICKRELHVELGFKAAERGRPHGFFAKKSDRELLDHLSGVIRKHGITSLKELRDHDQHLYETLNARELMHLAGLKRYARRPRVWVGKSDEEVLEIARRIVKKEGIENVTGLEKTDKGLVKILRQRKLLGRLGIARRRMRDWASMEDGEVVSFVRELISERSIRNKKSLQKADRSLYNLLLQRGLMKHIEPMLTERRWIDYSDKELFAFAMRFIETRGITGRYHLERENGGLYKALRQRGLLGSIGLKNARRALGSMGEDEIVLLAHELIDKEGISSRSGFIRIDRSLYEALRRRGLLGRIFDGIGQVAVDVAIREVIDALGEFG